MCVCVCVSVCVCGVCVCVCVCVCVFFSSYVQTDYRPSWPKQVVENYTINCRVLLDLSYLYLLRSTKIGKLVNNQLDAQFFFNVCLFLFSTCFGEPRAHHQEN